LKCRPPSPTKTKRIRVALNEQDFSNLESGGNDDEEEWIPEWVKSGAKHVVWGPKRDMDGLDKTILKLFVNTSQLDQLHSQDTQRLRLEEKPLLEKNGKELGGLSEEETLEMNVFGESFDRLSDEVKKIWRVNSEVQELIDELEQRLNLPQGSSEVEGQTKRLEDLVVGVHVR